MIIDDKGNVYCDTVTELRELFGGLINEIDRQRNSRLLLLSMSLFNILDGKYVAISILLYSQTNQCFVKIGLGGLLSMKFENENQFNTSLMEL